MQMVERVAAIIPAAGFSTRMGTLKPLLPIGNHTAVELAVGLFRKAGVGNVRVVVGHQSGKITPLLDRRGIKWVFNEHYRNGMFSSVLAGVRDLEQDVQAFFLLPVDIPLVSPNTIKTLLDASRKGPMGIIYPRFQNRRGHPPLVPTRYFTSDITSDYPEGMRGLLMQYDHEALDVDVPDEAILRDCDVPEDYRIMIEGLDLSRA